MGMSPDILAWHYTVRTKFLVRPMTCTWAQSVTSTSLLYC